MTNYLIKNHFLLLNSSKIFSVAIKNEHKIGYVSCSADENFLLENDSLRFLEGPFNNKDFKLIEQDCKPEAIPEKVCWFYYSIFFKGDKTYLRFKQLAIAFSKQS